MALILGPGSTKLIYMLAYINLDTQNVHEDSVNPYENELHTPYSKMAENTSFFCLHVNWPSWPRSHLQNSKESLA